MESKAGTETLLNNLQLSIKIKAVRKNIIREKIRQNP